VPTGLLAKCFIAAPDQNDQILYGPPPVFMGAPNGCRFIALSEGGAQSSGPIVTEIGVGDGRSARRSPSGPSPIARRRGSAARARL
jgi:hypothetical protein